MHKCDLNQQSDLLTLLLLLKPTVRSDNIARMWEPDRSQGVRVQGVRGGGF